MGSSFLDLLLVQPYRTNKMNKFIGLAFSTLVVCTSADKSFEQSQYSSGSAGAAGGFGGSAGGFGGAAGGFGGGDASYASDAAGGPGSLEEAIPGTPGEDYPIFSEVPETSFLCDGQADGGYYADPEAECRAFHICANDGSAGLTKYSFLCPNGTLFQQQYFVCDWWFNVDCSTAEEFYSLNDEIAAERAANSPEGSDGAGQYQGGAGQGGGARRGGSGSSSGRRGGSSGSQAAASSPRGSYTYPDASGAGPSYTSPAEFGGNGFGSADAGYGAPGGSDGGFGGAGAGYGAPALGGYSRRNARGLPVDEISEFEVASDIEEDIEY